MPPSEINQLRDRCGARIRRHREAQGHSLRGLASLTGIHYTHLWALEQGRCLPSYVHLRSLAKVLKLDGNYLLCRS